ncbi:MAG: hypothetical protein AB1430_08940 [Pseudomonadota bacterium]
MIQRPFLARLSAIAAAASTGLLPAAAFAQTPGRETQQHLAAGEPGQADAPFFARAVLGSEAVVKNAPYCADATRDTSRPLADGNRIVRQEQVRSCRDAEGRTREEITQDGHRSILLRDPVVGEAWMIDMQGRRALKLPVPPQAPGGGAASERVAQACGLPVLPGLLPAPAGAPAGMLIVHVHAHGPSDGEQVTPLGSQQIAGLAAEGQRTTWTVPAGRRGNEQALQISREEWRSSELGITLRSHTVDPLAGDERYEVSRVQRGEAEAALFRVPADYQRLSAPGGPGVKG